jgi:lysophospholipase L1-like esterase
MQIFQFFIYILFTAMFQSLEKNEPLTYLALGDSYTIGEGVPIYESYPYQTVQLLREKGLDLNAAEIVAKTGWTTDELEANIAKTNFKKNYDFVSLLIGVNNQYRGRKTDEYAIQFEELLKKSIKFAGNKHENVFVISIPDWGATPFAEGRDRKKIGSEIDAFNNINKKISERFKVNYIEITNGSREALNNGALVTKDNLHPSAMEYGKWAEKLSAAMLTSKGK